MTTSQTPLPEKLPEIDLRQLMRLTDDTGMFQHALHQLPDPNHGYCVDDNCRALIAAVLDAQLRGLDPQRCPLDRYLGFVAYAFNPDNGRFRNFMSYDRRWLEEAGSDDSHARTLWSLGVTVRRAPNESIRDLADGLFRRGLPAARQFQFVHPWAYTLLGLAEILAHPAPPEDARPAAQRIAQQMLDAWRANATEDWPWWTDTLTWGNAKLSQAMIAIGDRLGRDDMLELGLRTLRWCLDVQTGEDGQLSIIGNDGWMTRDGHRARFDQQPIEAQGFVQACLAAAQVTGDEQWAAEASRCFEWFTGRNDLGVPLYHPETGGCQDGLRPDGPNKNQGAESVLAYLLSVLELHLYKQERPAAPTVSVAGGSTVGLGVIGASGFAKFCLEQYDAIEQVKPTAVWSRTPEHARTFAETTGVDAAPTIQALLDDTRVQLVHIATTPDTHAEFAERALKAGKHVLIEKPIATDLDAARDLVRLAEQNDRVLTVNQMMRHGPLVDPVARLIDARILGAPLRGMMTNRAGDSGLAADHWFWDVDRSGGIFVEHAVHFFDLLRSWLGDGTVHAGMQWRRAGASLVDQVAADVAYGPETSVNFYHSFTQAEALDAQDLRLIFERGEVRLIGWIMAELQIDAVLEESQIESLESLFDGCEVTTLKRYAGQRPTTRRRGRDERVDRLIRLNWRSREEKQTLYGRAVRALMADMLKRIDDRNHAMRVTAHDGVAALETALAARALAERHAEPQAEPSG